MRPRRPRRTRSTSPWGSPPTRGWTPCAPRSPTAKRTGTASGSSSRAGRCACRPTRGPSSSRASRPRSRSGRTISRASSTPRAGSCSCAGSSARGSCGLWTPERRRRVAEGALRLLGAAGEVGRLFRGLLDDVDLVDDPVRGAEADGPRPLAAALGADELEVADPVETLGLAERVLGGLEREGVGRAAAVAVEVDAAVGVRSQESGHVAVADAAVVEALGKHDDVAGEAVAAHVRGLPHVARLRLAAQRLVERLPELRAATVALAVRADDEERMVDGDARRPAARERGHEVEAAQILLVVDLELEEALLARPRRAEVELPPAVRAPLRLLDEQE